MIRGRTGQRRLLLEDGRPGSSVAVTAAEGPQRLNLTSLAESAPVRKALAKVGRFFVLHYREFASPGKSSPGRWLSTDFGQPWSDGIGQASSRSTITRPAQ